MAEDQLTELLKNRAEPVDLEDLKYPSESRIAKICSISIHIHAVLNSPDEHLR